MQRKLIAAGALLFLGLSLTPSQASAQKKKGKDASAKEEKAEDKSKGEPEKAEERGKGKGEKASPKAEDTSGIKVEKVEKGDEGMKTYTFGPQEVEGRLKSPQIQYFLRRVRAEFEAGALGHRSFLRELSYTRHHPSLR
ncbi:MAG: hypothetical protein H6718_10760 [Polyangiaceae bacterium]|nr:hypothetical protein [Myxococcales bacterium]MCB9585868.1 hypothetical protein [Polyangiaceae bacterium]MCB9607203.1 hypothetical protein [Polyangiaceae bacterium]